MQEKTNENDNKLDIYFEEEYGKLSCLLEKDNSEVITFVYEDEYGRVYNLFIKRLINIDINSNEKYYDIITPYGYGGPIIEHLVNENKKTKKQLVHNFKIEFEKYCKTNNIVSEFVRFHPILENSKDFEDVYEVQDMQQTVAIWCNEGRPFEVEFSSNARKRIRKNLREGMTYEVIKSPENLDVFKEVYYETMDRADAKQFYYFEDKYFDYLLENFKDNTILINIKNDKQVVIASALCLIYKNKFLHIHLSGTKKDYIKQSPAYSLRYAISEWAYKNKFKYAHGGGGTTNKPDDSLFLFKKQFSKRETFQFVIGKKIHNVKVYEKLVEKTNTNNSDFFPKYRCPKS